MSIDNNNFNDFPLPNWAIKRSKGNYMEVGAQLCTKDGRRCGNAFVNKIRSSDSFDKYKIIEVITDAGTMLLLRFDEITELFHQPIYIVDINKARTRFEQVTKNNI